MLGLLDCTPIPQFAIDLDHKITHWNRAIEQLTGFSAKQMIGTRDQWRPFYPVARPVLADLIIGNNQQDVQRHYRLQDVTKSSIIPNAWEATAFFADVGGTGRHCYFLAASILDAAGNIMGAIETVQDITQRILAENELRESQERYRILTEQVADGVALIQDQKLCFANDAFARIFGYAHVDALLGRHFRNLISKRDRAAFKSVCADTFTKGRRREDKILELRCIGANGMEFWIEAHNNVITWNGRKALLTTVRDISRRKYRELTEREEARHLRNENVRLKSQLIRRHGLGQIVGKSSAMQFVYENIIKAASSTANIIIYGESGTGKELAAQTIHAISDRHGSPLVVVNCGAIPEGLFESEFFGHQKGAFTGAATDKVGFLESAMGGYLFLDEVGEIPLNMQVKLLRFLEGGEFTPVGGTKAKRSNARIIAATNRDLKSRVKTGLMREDFFYRIHVVPIHIPPLRKRMDDLPLLIYHFLDKLESHQRDMILPDKAIKAMQLYSWPGNVRELKNVIQRYVTFNELEFLEISGYGADGDEPGWTGSTPEIGSGFNLGGVLKRFEKDILLKAMRQEKGNRTRAAMALGIERRSLQRKLKNHQIE
jgi:PAS domain S-box-containing protein